MTTFVGAVQFKRRDYQDKTWKQRKELIKILVFEKFHGYSWDDIRKGYYLFSELTYREARDVLDWLSGNFIIQSSIGLMMREFGEKY